MALTVSARKNAVMLAEKRRKIQKRKASRIPVREGVWISSKADAFIDGIGSLLDLFPDPRPRTISAFICHHAPHKGSVNDAIWGDWVVIGQDMWAAIEAHKHEAVEEATTSLKPTPAR